MNRHLLDTNFIGNVAKPAPSESLLAWMAEQADESLFISALTTAEVGRGVLEMSAGRKRCQLETWLAGPERPPSLFSGRILPLDERAGPIWARLMADGKAQGRTRGALDTIIAATAEANDCVVVTDNARHFTGVQTFNPFQS